MCLCSPRFYSPGHFFSDSAKHLTTFILWLCAKQNWALLKNIYFHSSKGYQQNKELVCMWLWSLIFSKGAFQFLCIALHGETSLWTKMYTASSFQRTSNISLLETAFCSYCNHKKWMLVTTCTLHNLTLRLHHVILCKKGITWKNSPTGFHVKTSPWWNTEAHYESTM